MGRLFAIGVFAGVIAAPLAVDAAGPTQAQSALQGSALFAPTRDAQPFKNLFPSPLQPKAQAVPKPLFAVRPQVGRDTQGARVVCGMTLIPVDPAFDRAIRGATPERAPRPATRAVPAPTCEQGGDAGSSVVR